MDTPIAMTNDVDLHKKVIEIIKQKKSQSYSIADLGAGQGALTFNLKKEGFLNVKPFDITPNYWKLKDTNLNLIDFNENFSEKITEKFDIVCAVEVIEHVECPYHFLRQCHKILRKGGTLIITTPNVESFSSRMIFLWNGYLRYFSEQEVSNHHVTPIFGWYLRHAFNKIGYTDEKITYTTDKIQISNSLKGKLAENFLFPLKYFIKGDKSGANRIHSVIASDYKLPVSL